MSDEELMELIKSVDPLAVRLPPGIRAIANRIEQASRCAAIEEAAEVCEALESRISAGMLEAHERSGAPIDGSYLNACDDCADAIRALSSAQPGTADRG